MKPTHLKTLSAYVDFALKSAVIPARFMSYVGEYNNKLKLPVTLAHFVPCDENGVPLEKPTMDAIRKENPLHTPWDLLLHERSKAYNEAQKSVIFEGWEVFSDIEVRNKNDDRLNFRNGHVFYDLHDGDGGYIGNYLPDNPTLADLAAATTKNPLKLK
jgi:hypothetical protein